MISPGASGQHYYDRQILPVLPWLPLPLKEFLFSIYFPGGVEEQLSLPHSWSSSLDRTGAAPTSAKDKTVHGGACSTKFRQLAAVRRASSRVGKLSRAAALAHPRNRRNGPEVAVIYIAANVRFGSLADIEAPLTDVRFTPRSRHRPSALRCLLFADMLEPRPNDTRRARW